VAERCGRAGHPMAEVAPRRREQRLNRGRSRPRS
jgi:hypothetical protein